MKSVNTSSVAKRRYHSPLRQAQAEATRERILDAALERFSTLGYGGTSIAAVAAAAGVSPETIYASFGSKRALIDGIVDRVDAERAPERARARAEAQGSTPEAILTTLAEVATDFWSRNLRVVTLLREGIGDPDIGDRWMQRQALRHELIAGAMSLIPMERLRQGMDHATATDVAFALTSDDLYRVLAVMRGWTPQRTTAWLREEIVRALLADG